MALIVSACDDGDVGKCCSVLIDDADERIPMSRTSTSGQPTSDIALDPAFDCSSLICVAYQGSQAYCTERCFAEEDCPEGFSCRAVLEADPGPTSEIRPSDKFCVKDAHVCEE